MMDNSIIKHPHCNGMSNDEAESTVKPIRVGGDLKKALFPKKEHTSNSSDNEE